MFQLFGLSHLSVLACVVVATIAAVLAARGSGERGVWVSRALALILIADRAALLVWAGSRGLLKLEMALPMQLCDWTVAVTVLALLFRWRLAYVLAFFWGLSGTVQALLTPDLGFDFPDFRFFAFFISHGTVVVAVLFLTLATPLRPRARDILVAFGWSNIYLVAALLVNAVLDVNYGYLCAKPEHPSLLDHLGPWPWYLLSLELMALISFAVCYAPFLWIGRRRRADAAQ